MRQHVRVVHKQKLDRKIHLITLDPGIEGQQGREGQEGVNTGVEGSQGQMERSEGLQGHMEGSEGAHHSLGPGMEGMEEADYTSTMQVPYSGEQSRFPGHIGHM